MPITPSQLAFLPQQDKNALYDWLAEHAQWHELVREKAVRDGHVDLGGYGLADMADRDDWLYFHNDEHVEISTIYNLAGPPDLTYWDENDVVNWNAWLQAHALIHQDEQQFLNL